MRKYNLKAIEILFMLLLGIILAIGVGKWQSHLGTKAIAQNSSPTVRPEQAATIIYEEIPDFPQENQYRRQETGEIDPEHTLISRLVRYHQDVKQRPTQFRLDWQLTLADYLGVNEPMKSDRYPGDTTLQSNPMDNDIEVIRRLNLRQRRQLVDLLVRIYQVPTDSQTTTNTPSDTPQTEPTPTPTQGFPSLSEPGDAQLLLPD